MKSIHFESFQNIDSLSQSLAKFIETTLQNILSNKQHATLVVPGGSTPRHYLPVIAKCQLPWDRITITLSDERWVSVDNTQSNEYQVKKYLIEHPLVNAATFVSLKTKHDSPFDAIDEIHERLDYLPSPLNLTILGMGEDGHIASLFPDKKQNFNPGKHCLAVNEKSVSPSLRISLSPEMLRSSENIALIIPTVERSKTFDKLIEQLKRNDLRIEKEPILMLLQECTAKIKIFQVKF